jgi:hypothetical protein
MLSPMKFDVQEDYHEGRSGLLELGRSVRANLGLVNANIDLSEIRLARSTNAL